MKTIKEVLENSVEKYPKNIAFYEKVGKEYVGITYEKLYNDVVNLGNALIEKGAKDKFVGIIGKNSYEWAVAYLATACGVGKVVPLDKQLTKNELDNCLKRLNIDTLFYSEEVEDKIEKDNIDAICMQTEMLDLIEDGKLIDKYYDKITIDENEPAVFLFTSGTTQDPKIVMLSNKNILYNLNNTDQFMEIKETDKLFSVLPMHHTFEATFGFLTPIYHGASIIHVDSLKNIQKDMLLMKPTVLIGVPRIVDMFDSKITKEIEKKGKMKLIKNAKYITNIVPPLRKPIFKSIHDSFGGNLKTVLVGGAPVNPDVLKRLREYGFNVLQGYGLTECAPLVAGNQKRKYNDNAGGIALRGTDVRIFEPNEDGIGEIIVKGDNVMVGYYENEEATNEVIIDGYFHTGDLGIIDKKGFIYIKGRSKNLIVTSNGKNIYPEELETLIEKNDSVSQVVVSSGVDNRGNDIVKAEIVLIDKLLKKINESEKFKEEITKVIKNYIKEINENITEYKRIRQVELKTEPFPETSTKKVKRFNNKNTK